MKLSPKAANILPECEKRGETPKMWAGKMLVGGGLGLGPGFRTELDHWEESRGGMMAGRTGKLEDLGQGDLMEGLQVPKFMKSCQAKEGCLLHGQVEQPKTKGLKL